MKAAAIMVSTQKANAAVFLLIRSISHLLRRFARAVTYSRPPGNDMACQGHPNCKRGRGRAIMTEPAGEAILGPCEQAEWNCFRAADALASLAGGANELFARRAQGW